MVYAPLVRHFESRGAVAFRAFGGAPCFWAALDHLDAGDVCQRLRGHLQRMGLPA